jgi:ribose transport system permease protein
VTTTAASTKVDADEDESATIVQRLAGTQAVWILGVLVVIVAFFAIAGGDRFLSADNFSLISQNLAVLAVLGAGMTFVIITSGIDLSIGSVLVFSSVISAKLMSSMGGDGAGVVIAGVVAAVVAGAAWGWLNGFLIAYAKIPALIVTLGTLSAALGLAYVLSKGINITVDATSLTDFGIYTRIAGMPALPLLALVIVVIFGIALHRTRFGRHTYAIGSNQEAARRVGIRVDRHLMLVYLITGVLGGIGAVMYLAQFGTTTIGGQSLTNLNVIAAVVIGGTSIFGGYGSMFGTMVGLFIPAILQSGFVIIGVDPFWQGVAVGAVLIAAVYVDQTRRAAAQRGASRGKQAKEGTKA